MQNVSTSIRFTFIILIYLMKSNAIKKIVGGFYDVLNFVFDINITTSDSAFKRDHATDSIDTYLAV